MISSSLFDPFDILFRDYFKTENDLFSTLDNRIGKPVDIYTDDKKLVIEVAVVGVAKEDIEIKVTGDVVRISYQKKSEPSKTSESLVEYRYKGISKSSFDLGYKIDSKYDLSKIDASLDLGILKVTIPVKEKLEPENKIITIR